MTFIRAAFLLTLLLTTSADSDGQDRPKAADPRLTVELFAAAPDIVQPIALDFDAKGRLLVVESHTHFRPAKYSGPKFDRIRAFEDTDGDGKADRITTFFEGTTHTMDLAVHHDGSVYVATRNEILRLRDTDNDGKADEKTRIVFLDTKGNYPHNGLAGLSFDFHGNLTFGMGENLGADYKLTADDGTNLNGGGEGGNVYQCTADGKNLRRVATGFWNPFGSGRDIFGRLFVVDNDPDSSPPCRLLHVVEGADFGYQFRYGRAGRHPFQAWNGELPGTLPMVAGTGESPCEVVAYESDGLPAEYRGHLLVPAWADHRVERYVLKPNGASFTADRKPFVQGGKEFRPSGLAVAPDGSVFVTDWVSQSYELHGKGAIWRIRWTDAKPAARPDDAKEALSSLHRPAREAAARTLAQSDTGRVFLRDRLSSPDSRERAAALTALIDAADKHTDLAAIARSDSEVGLLEMAVSALVARGADVTPFSLQSLPASVRACAIAGLKDEVAVLGLLKLLAGPDPFIRHAARQRLSRSPEIPPRFERYEQVERSQRSEALLAKRGTGRRDDATILNGIFSDPDPDVRLIAAKWIADEKLTAFRPQIVTALSDVSLDPRTYLALTTTLARLDDKPVNEDSLAAYFVERLTDRTATLSVRVMALKSVPAVHPRLKTEHLADLLKHPHPSARIEVLRALKDRADPKSASTAREIAANPKEPIAVRAQALVTHSVAGSADTDFLIGLAEGPETPLRDEALRGLVQAKLTDAQRAHLDAIGKSDAVARSLGKPFHTGRPAATDTDTWLKLLEGPADPDAGRRVFEHPKLASCSRCHRVDGRGLDVGPDLSLAGRTERKWIVESLIQPSSVVAPHFQSWKVDTADGRSRTGLLVRTHLDESIYVDSKGERFTVVANDVVEAAPVRTSIMPDGLLDNLTDQEIRDLVAFLASRK